MQPAPLYQDVAMGPEGGAAYWRHAADGVRLRLAAWPIREAKGTVLLFSGRTEYVEKYGQAAAAFQAGGYGVITLDWRGQGLSDRLLPDAAKGHVVHFADFQQDVQVLLDTAAELDMPRPYFLLAHSMGGMIGLRALINGLDVQAATFSAPMWNIRFAAPARPVAWGLSWASRLLGLGHLYAPGTNVGSYVLATPFPGNELTTDADSYALLQTQMRRYPQLQLSGPTLNWLFEALSEGRKLARIPSPEVPTLTFLGSNERIVEPKAIIGRMQGWTQGRLELIQGAEHEVLMERPGIRERIMQQTLALFDAHG